MKFLTILLWIWIVVFATITAWCIVKLWKTYDVVIKHISKEEFHILNEHLKARYVGDCVLTREGYGFKCIDKSGKVFKIII